MSARGVSRASEPLVQDEGGPSDSRERVRGRPVHRPVFVTDQLGLSRPLGFGRGKKWPAILRVKVFPQKRVWV